MITVSTMVLAPVVLFFIGVFFFSFYILYYGITNKDDQCVVASVCGFILGYVLGIIPTLFFFGIVVPG